jgi:hypothetical protein
MRPGNIVVEAAGVCLTCNSQFSSIDSAIHAFDCLSRMSENDRRAISERYDLQSGTVNGIVESARMVLEAVRYVDAQGLGRSLANFQSVNCWRTETPGSGMWRVGMGAQFLLRRVPR